MTGGGGKATKKLKTILNDRVFHSDVAQAELDDLMGFRAFFKPKPVPLVETLIEMLGKEDAVVLDAFAGSGTTGHAVLRLRQRKILGPESKFILVQIPEELSPDDQAFKKGFRNIVDVTCERLRRAIQQEKVGSFTYCELGDSLDLDKFFDGKGAPSYEQVARYVVYTATGQSVTDVPKEPRKDWFVAEAGGYRIHLIYKPDLAFMRGNQAALSMPLVEQIAKASKGKPVLVYAAAKFMAQAELTRKGITFCQLPYSIHRVLGEAPDAP
ncbi:MAG: DNA methyltransferase [Pseudomonadota bacterium]